MDIEAMYGRIENTEAQTTQSGSDLRSSVSLCFRPSLQQSANQPDHPESRRLEKAIQKVLAALYEVETKVLNQAVKRNAERFPEDFMFQLSADEFANWKSQIVTSNPAAKMGVRRRPYAFTEQGVAMLSSVLRSDRAVAVNIEIMRAFVRLRRLLASHAELARKLGALEKKYDAQFKVVFDAIRQLMIPPSAPDRRRIGFHAKEESEG